MPGDEDNRYQRVLDEFSKFSREFQTFRDQHAREFQDFKTERLRALNDVEQRLAGQIQTYWQATAAALRQLSDWHARTEDKADKERTTERWVVRGGMAIMIALLLLDIYLRTQGR